MPKNIFHVTDNAEQYARVKHILSTLDTTVDYILISDFLQFQNCLINIDTFSIILFDSNDFVGLGELISLIEINNIRASVLVIQKDTPGSPARHYYPIQFTSGEEQHLKAMLQRMLILQSPKLPNSDRLFNTLVESVMDFIFLKDAERKYVMINKAFVLQFGIPKESYYGKLDEELFDPEISLISRQSDDYVLEKKKPIIYETAYYNSEGEHIFLETIKTPLLGHENNIEGIVGISRDITPKKLQEEIVRRNTTLLKESEQITRSGSFEYLIDQKIFTCSDQFRQILGFDELEFVDLDTLLKSVYELDKPIFNSSLQNALEHYLPFSIEHRFQPKHTNEPIDCKTSIKIDTACEQHVLYGTIVDVTEERNYREAILNAQEEERRSIAADIHDSLTQRLVAANMYLSSLRKESYADDHEKLETANNLIKSALEETRAMSRTLSLRSLQNTGLKNALLDIVESIPMACEVRYEFTFDENKVSNETATHLYRIIQESFANIFKHAKANQIELLITTDQSLLTCIIKDDGCGFEYSSVKNGNGLNNIKQRVSKCHGLFKLESQNTQGTKIEIVLPIK